MNPKEYGSDFQFPEAFFSGKDRGIKAFFPEYKLTFSGRSALYDLLQYGIKHYDWHAVYLPEYYCHEVDHYIARLPINIVTYPCGPWNLENFDWSALDIKKAVVIYVNFFGCFNSVNFQFQYASLIEDHTHAPFSLAAKHSRADYCFASLRKVLPVPCGGVIWSPKSKYLPHTKQSGPVVEELVNRRIAAMLLKSVYLSGGDISKTEFRRHFLDTEEKYGHVDTDTGMPTLAECMLNSLDISGILDARRVNYQKLFDHVHHKEIIYCQKGSPGHHPFGFFLFFPNHSQQKSAKQYLVHHHIYPAVLWPDQTSSEGQDFSERILMIHCDFRHSSEDINAIADIVNQIPHAS